MHFHQIVWSKYRLHKAQFQLPVNLKEDAKQHDSKFFLQHLNLFRKRFFPSPIKCINFFEKGKNHLQRA